MGFSNFDTICTMPKLTSYSQRIHKKNTQLCISAVNKLIVALKTNSSRYIIRGKLLTKKAVPNIQIPTQEYKKYEEKNQGYMTPPKITKSLVTDSKDTEVDEISDKKFKRIILIKLNDIQENITN
jgi:hypothetical protein